MTDPIREISDVDPSAHLPLLTDVAKMEPKKRRQALALWVTWFNSHGDKITPELEQELDNVLEAVSRVDVNPEQMEKLQQRFDQWLKSAGRVGVGRGPSESESPWMPESH
jgi:hypothetical protein